METKHIDNVKDIIDRLVENNCDCEYHKETNTIEFMSCPTYELSNYELIGYHYVGVYQRYEVSLDEIGWDFNELVSIVVTETKKKVAINIQERLKNNVINILENEIKYLS